MCGCGILCRFMAEHDDLYRDPSYAEAWEQGMKSVLTRNDRVLYDSVVAWSQILRGTPINPIMYRLAVLNLMEGKRQHVTESYHLTAREDWFHRLVVGQPVNVDRCVPWVEDLSEQSYGPIPAPVSFVPPLLDDIEQAGYDGDVTLEEVGCGTGLTTAAIGLMRRKAGLKIRGIDWNGSAVEVARRSAESFPLGGVTFESGNAMHMDLSRGDVFYLHSPFKKGSDKERMFCDRLLREAATRPLLVATLYDVTKRFEGKLPLLNGQDGYHGVALFGSRHPSANNPVHPALSGAADSMAETAEA